MAITFARLMFVLAGGFVIATLLEVYRGRPRQECRRYDSDGLCVEWAIINSAKLPHLSNTDLKGLSQACWAAGRAVMLVDVFDDIDTIIQTCVTACPDGAFMCVSPKFGDSAWVWSPDEEARKEAERERKEAAKYGA